MKTWMLNLRYFLIGLVPTLCIFGLIGGIAAVWIHTTAALMPELPSLSLELSQGKVTVGAFGQEWSTDAPAAALENLAERFPTLVPRELRLTAWGMDEIFGQNWKAYLSENTAQ